MAEVMASAATSVLGSVIGKLAAMLTKKYNLARNVKRGIRFLRDELSTMEAVLLKLEDKDDDQIDPLTKDWRSKVRELSYDIEDCIDRFMLNHSQGGSKANFVRMAVQKVKTLFKDGGIAEEIQELKRLVSEQREPTKHCHDINQCLTATPQPELLDPRVPALYQQARDLVGIDAPRKEIMQLLKCEDKVQDKVVSIYGTGGQGKTTLAMEVYRKTTEAPFDCRAFVSVSQTPNMMKLLRDILSQISNNDSDHSQRSETVEQLIRTLKECLKDKRYIILIDDIWSVSAWELLRAALPISDNGSTIITTTRIKAVANSCCTGIAAQMYEAKPLSDDDSQTLFFKRLFFSGDDCHPDLKKVSNDILKKCCGLPLAIISIAGLLANRSKTVEVWGNVLRSISAAADKDSPIDKMKRILLLSYFDLPHHLKSCLLYLSVFPEDYSIDCRQLILLWVAEGLIPGQDREIMEQLGRSYLNELVNRSLVQPTKVGANGAIVKLCRVHDVILEFIVSKAVEDNFVTIWNGNGFSEGYLSKKIRRLSIQKDICGDAAEEIAGAIMKNAAHIRSINIFFDSNSDLVTKAWFRCCKLPEDIEKLQHLETLDVRYVKLENLPARIFQLHKLVRLFIPLMVQIPNGIGNLKALQELSVITLDVQSIQVIQELGELTNLRVLGIDPPHDELYWIKMHEREGHEKTCIMSMLSKLFTSVQELRVGGYDPDAAHSFIASFVVTPPKVRKLIFDWRCFFKSVDPKISSLVNLSRLSISVHSEANKKGIHILASLPMLLSLTISVPSGPDSDIIIYTRHAINRQGFQRLIKFNLLSHMREVALEFEKRAMPKLERLKLRLQARGQFKYGEAGLVLGLQNLASLKHVSVDIDCQYAVSDEVEALEDDISSSAGAHPKCPMLLMGRGDQSFMAQGCSRHPSDPSIPQ